MIDGRGGADRLPVGSDRAALSGEAYDATFEQGRLLGLDDAVERVLAMCDEVAAASD